MAHKYDTFLSAKSMGGNTKNKYKSAEVSSLNTITLTVKISDSRGDFSAKLGKLK